MAEGAGLHRLRKKPASGRKSRLLRPKEPAFPAKAGFRRLLESVGRHGSKPAPFGRAGLRPALSVRHLLAIGVPPMATRLLDARSFLSDSGGASLHFCDGPQSGPHLPAGSGTFMYFSEGSGKEPAQAGSAPFRGAQQKEPDPENLAFPVFSGRSRLTPMEEPAQTVEWGRLNWIRDRKVC